MRLRSTNLPLARRPPSSLSTRRVARGRLRSYRPRSSHPTERPATTRKNVRGGAVQLFRVSEPLRDWRTARVSPQRTRLDVANCVHELLEIHTPSTRYTAFPAAEAQRLTHRLELHHPLKHEKRLHRAELDLIVLRGRCVRQPMPDRADIERQVTAWVAHRNAAATWQVTTAHTRTKPRRLSPMFDD
jgi:hypothetical protein